MRSDWWNWFREIKLGGMLLQKFNDSPLEAFKFAYPEKFQDGTWKETDFISQIILGKGIASVIAPPTEIKGPKWRKRIDYKYYYFGSAYEGYKVAKLSDDFGGVFDPLGVLKYVFPLSKDPDRRYINVVREGLLYDPEEFGFDRYLLLRQSGENPSQLDSQALRLLRDEFGIDPFKWRLEERINIVSMVHELGLDMVREFYTQRGENGLRALANLSYQAWDLARRYPDACKQIFEVYMRILDMANELVAKLFGEEAADTYPEGFLGKLKALEMGIFSCIKKANDQIIEYLTCNTGPNAINTAVKAQGELIMILKMLKDYSEGNAEFRRVEKTPGYDSEVAFYSFQLNSQEVPFMVVTRPREIEAPRIGGEACIRFDLGGGSGVFVGRKIGFRIDRTYDEVAGKYVVVVDIEGPYLKEIGDYHHPFLHTPLYESLADEETFAQIVRIFRKQ